MTCFGLINDQYKGEAAMANLVDFRIGSPLYDIMAC